MPREGYDLSGSASDRRPSHQQGDRRDQGAARLYGRLPHDDRSGHLHHQRYRAYRRLAARPLPGVYYSSEMDSGKQIYKAQIIPSRGAWLEFEVDKRDQLMVSIDRKRKQSATMFLRALGIAVTNDDIIELLGNSDVIKRTLERDTALTREDALIEIYRRLRPGEPPTVDASAACSRACSLTRSATIWPASVVTRSTRNSTSPPKKRSRCSPTRISSRRCATSCPRCRRAGLQGRRHRPLRQPPHPHRRRARRQPVPYRHEPYGARRP